MGKRAAAGRRKAAAVSALAATALMLPLWLAGCNDPSVPAPPPNSGIIDGGQQPAVTGTSEGPAPQADGPLAPETTAPATPSPPDTGGFAGSFPSSTPEDSTPPPDASRKPEVKDPDVPAGPSGNAGGQQEVTAYFVLIDDGGSNGVRFGCNDSLVGVRQANSGLQQEPLPAAINALLDGGGERDGTASPVTAYSALSGSDLKFLSGSFDGTTVTVYLAGTVRPGGACDIPRVEAQLTQTAVAAVGAIRAEIYINGRSLGEVLRPAGSGEN